MYVNCRKNHRGLDIVDYRSGVKPLLFYTDLLLLIERAQCVDGSPSEFQFCCKQYEISYTREMMSSLKEVLRFGSRMSPRVSNVKDHTPEYVSSTILLHIP